MSYKMNSVRKRIPTARRILYTLNIYYRKCTVKKLHHAAVSIRRKLKGTETKNTNWKGTKRKKKWTRKKKTSKKKKIFWFQFNEEKLDGVYTVYGSLPQCYWNILHKSWRHWFEFVSCRESELRNSYSGETEQIILYRKKGQKKKLTKTCN